jgi:hypothetical protein
MRKFIDENCKPDNNILEILKDNYENKVTKICYVFYDYNRGVLLPQNCVSSDIVVNSVKNSYHTFLFSHKNE